MSKSERNIVRKAESVIPKSIRRADKQAEMALKCLSQGDIHEIWDDVEELEEFDTRTHLTHKQPLR